MNNLFSNIVAGLLRHALTYGGGMLVSAGYLDADQNSQIVGAVLTIIGVAWSAYQKQAVKKSIGPTAPIIPVVDGGPLPPVGK